MENIDELLISIFEKINNTVLYSNLSEYVSLEIIKNNPNKSWEWNKMSKNPNINLEFIQNNHEQNWDWCYLSSHPIITWEFIQNNPDKNWNWRYDFNWISKNPNITFDIIKNIINNLNSNEKEKCINQIVKNPNITFESIPDNYIEIKIKHPNITLEYFEKILVKSWNINNVDTIGSMDWIYREISKNNNLSLDIIEYLIIRERHNQYIRIGDIISNNPNITPNFIEKYKNIYIRILYINGSSNISEYYKLSNNPNITSEFVQNNLDKYSWDWNILSKNPNITSEFVQNNLGKYSWDWNILSKNPNITWEFIKNNFNQIIYLIKNKNIKNHLDWKYIFENYTIDFNNDLSFISKNYEKFYISKCNENYKISLNQIYTYISKNPNLTFDIIKKNMDIPFCYTTFFSLNPNGIKIIEQHFYILNLDLYERMNFNSKKLITKIKLLEEENKNMINKIELLEQYNQNINNKLNNTNNKINELEEIINKQNITIQTLIHNKIDINL